MPGNIADTILQMLNKTGVRSLYGVSGDAIFPLLDAVSRQDKIKYYSTACERGAAFMASYEAKVTGKLGKGIKVTQPGELEKALSDALNCGQPVVIDVQTAEAGLPCLV